MSSLKSKLAAASPRWADIEVCLNGDLSMKRDELHEALQVAVQRAGKSAQGADDRLAQPTGAAPASDQRLGQPNELEEILDEISRVEDEMRSQIITLRLTTLPSDEYEMAKVTAGAPRSGVAEDEYRGHNVPAFIKAAAAASGQLVEGEQLESISDEEWAELWHTLSAGDFDRIKYAVINLNETNGHAGVEYLKKGSRRTRNSGTTSA